MNEYLITRDDAQNEVTTADGDELINDRRLRVMNNAGRRRYDNGRKRRAQAERKVHLCEVVDSSFNSSLARRKWRVSL